MLKICLVDPREDPTIVEEFCTRQAIAYGEFEAEKAATPITDAELDRGCVRFIVARDELTDELAGGLRLYLRLPGTRLPVERLLWDYAALVEEIERWSHRGIAEIGGTWVHSRWRGIGLGVELYRFAIAMMPLLGVTRGLAFSHHHVIPSWEPLGWTIDQVIGSINYPDARYESSVIWIDPLTLHDADTKQRVLTFNLRAALRQNLPVRWSVPTQRPERPALADMLHTT
jgi:GNAT superfamily N-acetyltransferase